MARTLHWLEDTSEKALRCQLRGKLSASRSHHSNTLIMITKENRTVRNKIGIVLALVFVLSFGSIVFAQNTNSSTTTTTTNTSTSTMKHGRRHGRRHARRHGRRHGRKAGGGNMSGGNMSGGNANR
jgi:hypothetical protein